MLLYLSHVNKKPAGIAFRILAVAFTFQEVEVKLWGLELFVLALMFLRCCLYLI